MSTYAELSGQLLNDAAAFFRTLAAQNEELRAQMTENATVFEQMATIIVDNPQGELSGTPNAELAGRLLVDASKFFLVLSEQNDTILEQMQENARVYKDVSVCLVRDPLGIPKV